MAAMTCPLGNEGPTPGTIWSNSGRSRSTAAFSRVSTRGLLNVATINATPTARQRRHAAMPTAVPTTITGTVEPRRENARNR
jgi:hypothetical protein